VNISTEQPDSLPQPSGRPRVAFLGRWLASGGWFPVVLLGLAILWLWPDLNHPSITSWDEGAHQAATRGIFDTGLPTIVPQPLVPDPIYDWMRAKIFLHKPPLPFYLGALVMSAIGVTPLGLRLISFIATFITAAGMFLFGRRLVGKWPAGLVSIAFLGLTFGLTLIRGYQFGDVTDCTLLVFSLLSVWALSAAIERDSLRLALLAGALCGLAFLCKSLLALTPLGMACALAVLGARGWGPRVRLRLVLGFAAAAILVAAPWNLYAAATWPDVFDVEVMHALGFLNDPHRPFSRPFTAIFDPVLSLELAPWPVMLFLVAGLWLIWAAFKRRDLRTWVLCLWLWGEWIPLAIARVKVPAHAWGSVAAALLAMGLLLRDSRTRPWLSGAALATFGNALALSLTTGIFLPDLTGSANAKTRAIAALGVLEGLALVALGGGLAWLLARLADRRARWLARLLWGFEVAAAVWVALVASPLRLRAEKVARQNQNVDCYDDVVGRLLDGLTPERSIIFYPVGAHDPVCCYEQQSMIFYSGRMVYLATGELLRLAKLQGYHRYLVSGVAQPYRPVPGIPASAWLQAYDLDAPLPSPAPPPADLIPIDVNSGSLHFFGMAAGPGDSTRDRYLFYAEPINLYTQAHMEAVFVLFTLADGSLERAVLDNRRTVDAIDFSKAWFTLTLAGPPREKLKKLQLEGVKLPLP
jgi:4-amino-4-deoxy-L-arabinose transferase-like glycosyltransferase